MLPSHSHNRIMMQHEIKPGLGCWPQFNNPESHPCSLALTCLLKISLDWCLRSCSLLTAALLLTNETDPRSIRKKRYSLHLFNATAVGCCEICKQADVYRESCKTKTTFPTKGSGCSVFTYKSPTGAFFSGLQKFAVWTDKQGLFIVWWPSA